MQSTIPKSPEHESLLYGDCLEVMREWEDETVDLTSAGTIAKVRDFLGTLAREKAVLGVFITLEQPPGSWTAEAAQAGKYIRGAESYPRCQIWSIAEHFEGIRPHLPAMLDPLTGKPMLYQATRLTDW